MNPSEINRRIAVLCGWTDIEDNKGLMVGVPVWIGYPPTGAVIGKKQPIHDYRHSLDACAEFQTQALMTSRMVDYYRMIRKVIGSDDGINAFVAGPSTRCEAFLRMHNQWEEK